MKKMLGLAAVFSLFMAVEANAAMYRLDFNGTISDGTYSGYFTYDDAGLDLNNTNFNFTTGLETDMEVNFNFSGYSGSFDETTAGVGQLNFSGGNPTYWAIGGNVNGPGGFFHGSGTDFILNSYSSLIEVESLNDLQFNGSAPQWNVTKLSAVPLPAAGWAFGAGLLGLAGLKRRKKKTAALQA